MNGNCSIIFVMIVPLILSIASTTSAAQLQATVEITGFSFQPASLMLPAGTDVIWINRDPVAHTVAADDGSFSSPEIEGNGGRFERAFAKPGTYSYHCSIHPFMRGVIVVSESQAGSDPASVRPQVKLEPFAEGFTAPMELISTKDGTGRLFLVDQIGVIKVIEANGTVHDRPFLDLRGRMVELNTRYDERGLLGLAFHPDFAKNGRLFVFYSAPLRPEAPAGWSCTNRLSELSVSQEDPNMVNMTSERIVLLVDKPQLNHNGGTIAFGPDGYLYIPLGDGGGANDVGSGHAPEGNGQSTATLLGKILRIDVDGMEGNKAYGIPADNPFVDREGVRAEIYALGFRNPWRIAFDSGGEERLFVSDAGQNLWEEVDTVVKGGNYGWNIREGTHCFDPKNPNRSPDSCPDKDARGEQLIDPIIEYGHDLGSVVVGGYLYRGQALAEMYGKYIFADWSKSFSNGNGTLLVATPSDRGLWSLEAIDIFGRPDGRLGLFIRSFGMDEQGEIYLLASAEAGPANSTGKIFKILPA